MIDATVAAILINMMKIVNTIVCIAAEWIVAFILVAENIGDVDALVVTDSKQETGVNIGAVVTSVAAEVWFTAIIDAEWIVAFIVVPEDIGDVGLRSPSWKAWEDRSRSEI